MRFADGKKEEEEDILGCSIVGWKDLILTTSISDVGRDQR